jgi:ferritin-like metal-binding protein YciE
MTTKNSLRGLYLDELKDIYGAEKQLTKALPKMVKAAASEELRNGFTEHLQQTRGHVERLEQIFEAWASVPAARSAWAWKDSSRRGRR